MKIKQRKTEPFHYKGGETGCLLIHGFTGSPAEMAYLGQRLANEGFTVTGLRLPGHGTTVEDMAVTEWEDWRRAVQLEFESLRKSCKIVIAVGLSMGGLLALDLATEGLVDAAVAMNAPMILQSRKARFAFVLYLFRDFADKPKQRYKIKDKQKSNYLDKNYMQEGFWYDKVPVKSLASLNRAIRNVRKKLPLIKCPLLLMQSANDKTVNPKSLRVIEKNLSVTPELRLWQRSGHILTLGSERENVVREIIRFTLEQQRLK